MSSNNNDEHNDVKRAGGPLGYWVEPDLKAKKLSAFEVRLHNLRCEDAYVKQERDAEVQAAIQKAVADFHQAVHDARMRLFKVDLTLVDDLVPRITVTLSRPVTIA